MNQYSNDKELREFLKENLRITVISQYDAPYSHEDNDQRLTVKLELKGAADTWETISEEKVIIHVD